MARTNIRGSQIADGANGVDLTVDVTGTLPLANGGTNATSASAALNNLGGAPIASPAFTGTPTAPTAAALTNTTQLATTAFVNASRIAAVGVVNVKDYGATGNGTTDDTTAISNAYAATSGKPLFFPSGVYKVTSFPALTDGDRVVGAGPLASEILYTGTGTLVGLTNKQDVQFRSIGVHMTGAGAKAIDLSGCFQVSIDDMRIRGDHTGSTGSTYHGQKGIIVRDNTGNTRINNTVLANLGVGVETSCIQNQLVNSKIVNTYKSIVGVGGTANAGLYAIACEFVGDDDVDTTQSHVDITGSASAFGFDMCWFEKSNYGLIVGVSGSGGPSLFSMNGCHIGARNVGIQFNYCRQPTLTACEFAEDSGGSLTEIVFGGGGVSTTDVQEGEATQLVSLIRGDFADSDFPQYWVVTRKGQFRAPNITSSSNVTVAGTVETGNLKVLNGAGVGKVLVSDADGDATWTTLSSGSGDVTAASSFGTDNRLVRSDGTGKGVQASTVTVSDAGEIVLPGVASATHSAGKLVYDTDNDSLTFFNSDSAVAMQVGQEEWIRVRNVSGSTIANGVPVYISGVNSGLPTIAPAQANSATTTICVGLTTESIANNTNGVVTCVGVVRGINTASFTAGATVFLSSAAAGALVTTVPTSPNYRYRVGIVVVSNATTGSIHVTPSTAALGNGTANQLSGIASGGTQEYKTLSGTTNDLTVTHGAGTITLATGSNVPKITGGTAATGKAVIRDSGGTNSWLYIPWEAEIYLNSTPIAASYIGYSDNDGGVIIGASRGVLLEQVVWRLSSPTAVIGGSGNFQIQWYLGSPTTQETTLIQTTQIAAGQHDATVTFGAAQTCTVNTVLRAKITSGTATLPSKSSVQWRGSYL